jgi:hypothetical protein
MPEAMEAVRTGRRISWKTAHDAVLAEVKRTLRAGGWILLGVSNGLGIARPHSQGTRRVRTYWGYRRALREAGFSKIQFYASLPSHQEPFFIFPVERRQPLNYFVKRTFAALHYRGKLEERGLGVAYQLALRLQKIAEQLRVIGFGRYFLPSYLIVARK